MSNDRNIAEKRLKAETVERLYDLGHLDHDAVMISEMVTAAGRRRADIVVANGKLCAFEIKSKNDSLRRLHGQVSDLARTFEKTIVVADARFEENLRAMLPKSVGIWISAGGSLFERRKPRTRSMTKAEALSFLLVRDLRVLLREQGISLAGNVRRVALEKKANDLPREVIVSFARRAVKRRYAKRFAQFEISRDSFGTLRALDAFTCSDSSCVRRDSEAKLPRPTCAPEPILIHEKLIKNAPAGQMLMRARRLG